MNLGRHFHIPQKDWKLQCAKVEHILHHQKDLFPLDVPEGIEVEARRIAAQLQARRGEPESVAEPGHERLQDCLGLEGNPGGIQNDVVGLKNAIKMVCRAKRGVLCV